jgi:O-antigen ligase
LALYQKINQIGYIDVSFSIPRVFGTFSHPNSLALYLTVLIAFLFLYYFLNPQENFSRYWIPFFGGLCLLVILFTYTRVAWAAILIFFFYLGILRFRLFLILILIFSFTLYNFSPTLQNRISDIFSLTADNSLSWRVSLWKDALNETFEENRQWLGFGAGTFEIISGQRNISPEENPAAHNDFVRAFVEGGLLGLISYLTVLIYLFFFLARLYLKNSAQSRLIFFFILGIFLSISFSSLTDNVVRNTPLQWIFWLILGSSLRVFANNSIIPLFDNDNKNKEEIQLLLPQIQK